MAHALNVSKPKVTEVILIPEDYDFPSTVLAVILGTEHEVIHQ
jgi:hypothetical protein